MVIQGACVSVGELQDRRGDCSFLNALQFEQSSILHNRKAIDFLKHFVVASENGVCVTVTEGYYRHQTAFQRQLTARGMYKTGLVAVSAGADFPLLMISALSRNVLTADGEFIDLDEAERQIRKVPIVRRVLLYAADFHVSQLASQAVFVCCFGHDSFLQVSH